MKKYLILGSLVVLALILGGYFFLNQKGGRGIASVGGETSLSVEQNLKIQILKRTSLEVMGDEVHVHIGAFENVCQRFPLVEIVLRAEGIAVEGEVPTIKISRMCQHATSSDTLAPVIVPVKYLNSLPPDDQKFKDEGGQGYEIKNAAGLWPAEWHLFEIHLSDPSSGQNIDADGYEISFVKGAPLVVWFQ